MKHHEIKAIVESEFYIEMSKPRGKIEIALTDALHSIHIEIEKKLKRLSSGEDLKSIINDNPGSQPYAGINNSL